MQPSSRDRRAAAAPRCRTAPDHPTRSAWGARSIRRRSGPSTPATPRRASGSSLNWRGLVSEREMDDRVGQLREGLVGRADHDLRPGQLDDRREFAARQLRRHRLRDGTDLPAGEVGDEPVDRVRHGDGDERTLGDAVGTQFVCEPIRSRVELRSRERDLSACDGWRVGRLLRERAQPSRKRQDHDAGPLANRSDRSVPARQVLGRTRAVISDTATGTIRYKIFIEYTRFQLYESEFRY